MYAAKIVVSSFFQSATSYTYFQARIPNGTSAFVGMQKIFLIITGAESDMIPGIQGNKLKRDLIPSPDHISRVLNKALAGEKGNVVDRLRPDSTSRFKNAGMDMLNHRITQPYPTHLAKKLETGKPDFFMNAMTMDSNVIATA
jgi:hypothetical protein